ncbi:helix-turn-helix domain-containing protein [Haloglycomyces albus]|uniref:helix-turn-helix domain-containing protein n=1 Tax=Haloglycomyces albus TaxID=526067 RepID=UPI00046D2EC4|nr:helix-turn-helix transcriptional regulator [Haloglycomyces albus]
MAQSNEPTSKAKSRQNSKSSAGRDQRVSPTVRRRRIGVVLREMRVEAECSAQEAADVLECTTSTIYRMESGNVGIKPRDIRKLAEVYGADVDSDEVQEIIRIAGESRRRGWWARYSDSILPAYSTYVGLESGANTLNIYDGLIINGLLQTEDYARATFTLATEESKKLMEKRIELRMKRQERLGDDLKLWNILDEGALRRVIGGPQVMLKQLEHLLFITERPGVDVQVLPLAAGTYPGMLGSFTIMEFSEDPAGYRHPEVVYVESHNGDIYEEGDSVRPFQGVFNNLRSIAKGPIESREFIRKYMRELESL